MTGRNLWDDARDTAVETTRELFAPLTYVVRKITSGGRPATDVGVVAKRSGQMLGERDQAIKPSVNAQSTTRRQRGDRDRTPESRSWRARG